MKCFYDSTQDAVGTCKSCGKGLSSSYLVDLGKGLACKGQCEADVRALIALVDENVAMRGTTKRILQNSGTTAVTTPIIFFLMGSTFLLTGLFRHEEPETFLIILGALFMAWSLVNLKRAMAMRRTVSHIDEGKS